MVPARPKASLPNSSVVRGSWWGTWGHWVWSCVMSGNMPKPCYLLLFDGRCSGSWGQSHLSSTLWMWFRGVSLVIWTQMFETVTLTQWAMSTFCSCTSWCGLVLCAEACHTALVLEMVMQLFNALYQRCCTALWWFRRDLLNVNLPWPLMPESAVFLKLKKLW